MLFIGNCNMEWKYRRQCSFMSELNCGIKSSCDLDFSKAKFNDTMHEVEKAHWDYLDRVAKKYRAPRLGFYAFMEEFFRFHGKTDEIPNVKAYFKQYDKHKKSLPTAGVLIIHENSLLLVKVVGSGVYSLPKGKSNAGETLEETAVREVLEETGIDLRGVVDDRTANVNVHKTKLFIVETDEEIKKFSGYNSNEIIDIKWFNFSQIDSNPDLFSKQVKATLTKLEEIRYL